MTRDENIIMITFQFWDNVNRVLDEHDVWEEDDEVVEESSES